MVMERLSYYRGGSTYDVGGGMMGPDQSPSAPTFYASANVGGDVGVQATGVLVLVMLAIVVFAHIQLR